MADDMKKNDPYRGMDSGKEGIRPGFLGGKGGGDDSGGLLKNESKKERVSEAADELADAEEGAASEEGLSQEKGLGGARKGEEEARGFYSGAGKTDKNKIKGKKAKFSILKRGGPSFGIFGMILGIGGLMGGAQSLMPMAIEEMIIEKFNSVGISSTMASDAWLNTQLNLGVRLAKLTNAVSSSSGSTSGVSGDNGASWNKSVTISLGGPNAPLLWQKERTSGSWVQGATISDKYYIYALTGHATNAGHPDGRIIIVDRDTGEEVRRIKDFGMNDLNSLHYDYTNNQIWAQLYSGEENDYGVHGKCYNPDTGSEVACKTYGPRPYAGMNNDAYADQGRDAVNNIGFLAIWKQTNDLAIIKICPATSDCSNAHTITLNGFGNGEIEDIGFDSNGDMVLIFNRWDNSYTRVSYYKISSDFLRSNFNIYTVPLDGASTIFSDGSTGGVVVDYSDVTIIGDSISVDSAVGVNGNGRRLYDEYLPGADYGDTQLGNSVYRTYNGVQYTMVDYGKSFFKDMTYSDGRLTNYSGLEVLRVLKENGDLGQYVLFLLGTNDNEGNTRWLTDDDIRSLLKAVGPDRKIVLMTNYVHTGRGWSFNGKNNEVIRRAAEENPGRIAVADWGAIATDDDLRDIFHFTEAGGEKFVSEVKRALDSIRPQTYRHSSGSHGGSSGSSGSYSGAAAEELFAFSEFQVEQFEQQGIKVVTGTTGDATSFTALLYRKGVTYIPVVGSDYIGMDGLQEAIKTASGLNNVGAPISATEALADQDFKVPYTTASKAWRGGVSGWFDNIMSSVTELKLSINRNRWTRFVTSSINTAKKDFADMARSVALENTTDGGMDRFVWTVNDDGEGSYQVAHVVEFDADGATPAEVEAVKSYNSGDLADVDVSDTKVQASDSLNKIGKVLNNKAVVAASKIADYGCAILEAMTSIYTVVSAYQAVQFLNLITGFLESVDKVKAGEGASSPVNEYANNLTTVGPTTDGDNNVVATKTAMQSAGMAWLFNNSKISSSDTSVGNVNFENIMSNSSKLFSNVAITAKTYEMCGYVKAGLATINLVSTIISFIPVFGQGVKAIQITAKEVAKLTIKLAVQVALYALIPIAAKNLTKMLIENAATDWFGEDLGNALVSGAGKYLGGNGTSGGQSPGSTQKVLAYLRERDTVIADEAKYQRAIRSPFDITSQYTFLGSLYYSLVPFAYSNSSLMNVLSNSSSIVSSSIASITPTAKAIDEESIIASSGSCDLLTNSAGALGDAFCNPYIITDVSTMNYSPVVISEIVHSSSLNGDTVAANDDAYYQQVIESNFNGNEIKKDSHLARYITYCGQRTSPLGIKDLKIAEQVTGKDKTVIKIMDHEPLVLGDVSSIITGLADSNTNNLEWATGRICVAMSGSDDVAVATDGPLSGSMSEWDSEYKYYQRYMENMRLVENMNPGYESDITAFVNDYYEENPIDQSLEGQLARFSGMTKEQVEDTLALIEYYEFLDEYDPGSRYAFVEPDKGEVLKFDNDNELANAMYILVDKISYFDVRNRTFTV